MGMRDASELSLTSPLVQLADRAREMRLDFDMSKLLALGDLDQYHRQEHGVDTIGDEKIYL